MAEQNGINEFVRGLPKAELHVHIEGTFEPKLIFEIARRNGIKLKYGSVEELARAYEFNNLQEFLDIYYEGAGVLIEEEDFYDLTMSYMQRLHEQNAKHAEIFIDPQTHTDRGIPFERMMQGIKRALADGQEKYGITNRLIMCFLRHLSESAARETLDRAMDFKEDIIGVGLASSEVGHPPSKFEGVFKKAIEAGFIPVAHAGEEGPPEYVWEALKLLHVRRIDHGNRALEDPRLVSELAERQIPLTVCPVSNLKLRVVKKMEDHPIKKMLDLGLMATVNSDDPAYFGGSLNENYTRPARAVGLGRKELLRLAKNSFEASFLSKKEKEAHIAEVTAYASENQAEE